MTERETTPAAPERDDALPEDGLPEDLEGLREDELRVEVERARAQHQRAVADYQNLVRRSREERAEIGRLQLGAIVSGFLPALDDLDRAIESVDADLAGRPWVEGVRLVAQKFRGVLEAAGVEEIHALAQPFDPTKHEAVGQAPGPEGTVVHLARKGYAVGDRVIRPAMVLVGSGEGAAMTDQPDDRGDAAEQG
jgi:molecular chaperone GrpE